MKRIALLSDTHNYIDTSILKAVEGSDEIWHAGDFGSIAIAESLGGIAPLRGVYGNIDGPDIRSVYPEVNRFDCEQVNVLIIHIGGYPGKYTPLTRKMFAEKPPQLFISGHSHILKIIYDSVFKSLHINPGAAGKQGWHTVRTVVRFEVDGSEVKNCRIVELKR
ncbi:MAG TPA: metallophosphoesterase family protein [Flavitalea sp.]|nr:metallophosphoesterase family protein [Flavitalea sp.]